MEALVEAGMMRALTTKAQHQNMQAWRTLHPVSCPWHRLQQLGIMNVPLIENVQQVQFVINMLTGAWCRFTNWNACCFELYEQQLYFGDTKGNVNIAYVGGADLVTAIPADMQCAFNWFDDPGRVKTMKMVQPLMTADGQIAPSIAFDADFSNTAPSQTAQAINPGASWDNAVWDHDVWGGALVQVTNWLSAQGIGHALAMRLGTNVVPTGPGANSVFDSAQFDISVFDGVGTTPITLQINAANAIMELGGLITLFGFAILSALDAGKGLIC